MSDVWDESDGAGRIPADAPWTVVRVPAGAALPADGGSGFLPAVFGKRVTAAMLRRLGR